MILGPLYQEGAVCAPRRLGDFFEPILFFLCQKEKNGFNLPRKERGLSKPEVRTMPPSRQKKAVPFRFHRSGESSTSTVSFFLPKLRPFHWVTIWF